MKEQKNIIKVFIQNYKKYISEYLLNILHLLNSYSSIFGKNIINTFDININKPELSPFDKITKDLYKEFKD